MLLTQLAYNPGFSTKLPRRQNHPDFFTITTIVKDWISPLMVMVIHHLRSIRVRVRVRELHDAASSKHISNLENPWFEQLEVVDRCGPLNLARIPCTVATWQCGSCSGIQSILAWDGVSWIKSSQTPPLVITCRLGHHLIRELCEWITCSSSSRPRDRTLRVLRWKYTQGVPSSWLLVRRGSWRRCS